MRAWMLGLFASLLIPFLPIQAHAAGGARVQVQTVTDLQRLGLLARRKRLPVMLVFAAEHCGYCELLENEILRPMLISGDYRNKVIIRKVMIDSGETLTDFDGTRISADRFAVRHDIFVTPTTLFVDHDGRELAKRMLGINTIEFYAGDVDKAIDRSLRMLRTRHKHASVPIARR